MIRNRIPLWIVCQVCLAFTLIFSQILAAQTIPTGKRILDLGHKTWFGMTISSNSSDLDKTIFLRECNAGEIAVYPAWGLWPSEKNFDVTNLNQSVNYLVANGKPVIMHMFVGPNQYLPDWFKNGTYTKPALDKMLKDLIQNVIQTNGNDQKVNMWNIVNEAINWKGDGWEQAKWTELGFENDASGLTGQDKVFATVPVFIRKAFEYARLVTNKELELRDYDNDGLENQWNNSAQKSIMFYQLTKHLLAVGAPVTAVGFQGHFSIDNSVTWSKITNQVKKFKSLGLKVFITEMDAEQNGNVKTWNATIAERQKEYYYRYAKAALAGGVDGIFTWGIRDNQDPGWLNGENALLFDANGNPKPAYYGIQKAFSEDITLSINTKQQANLFPRAFRLFVIKDNSSTIIDGGQNHANGIFYCDLLGQRIKERGSSFGLDH